MAPISLANDDARYEGRLIGAGCDESAPTGRAGREEKDIDSETYRTYSYSHLSKHPVGYLALIVSIHPLMLALWL